MDVGSKHGTFKVGKYLFFRLRSPKSCNLLLDLGPSVFTDKASCVHSRLKCLDLFVGAYVKLITTTTSSQNLGSPQKVKLLVNYI